MSPIQVLSVLAGRRHTALAVMALTVAAAAAVSWWLPRHYTATAAVMLDARSAEQVVGGALNGMMDPGYRATQLELVYSERVARKAIAALGLEHSEALREQWLEAGHGQGDYLAWLAAALQKGLAAEPSRGSNVVHVSYTAEDGATAARMANAFVQAYIDTSVEMKLEPVRQYGAFFDAQARELRANLEAAQSRLSAYQREHGLLATDEKSDIENTRLIAELSSQVVLMQAAKAELAGRDRQGRKQPGRLHEVLNDPLVASLQTDLAREEMRAQELATRVGESHPQWVQQRSRLAELRSRLAAATAQASGSVSLNNSVNEARLAEATAALQAQREHVMKLREVREQAAMLQRDVENAQRAHDAVQLRAGQSSVERQNTHTNISVLKEATAPMQPTSPRVLRILGIGAVAGVLLGIGAALGRELLDRRLRTGEDLVELKQPLLISLPVADWRHAPVGSLEPVMKQRVLSGLSLSHREA